MNNKLKSLWPILLVLLMPVHLNAATQMVDPFTAWIDENGDPCSGCLVFTYTTGTTTKKTTWTDSAEGTANANPIVLDSEGRANIWIDGQYRMVLAPSTDTDPPVAPIKTVNNVDSLFTVAVFNSSIFTVGHTAAGIHLGYRLLSEFTSLSNAVSTLGATETDLWLDEDDTMTGHVSVPITLTLKPISGNIITLGAFNLSIASKFTPGPIHTFNENSTGKVLITTNVCTGTRPEWWTVNTTPGTTDMTSAVLSAVDAAWSSGSGPRSVLLLSGSIYLMSSAIVLPDSEGVGFSIVGDTGLSTLKASGATNLIETYDLSSPANFTHAIVLRNIEFDGNSVGLNGVRLVQPAHRSNITSCIAHDFTNDGFLIERPVNLYLESTKGFDNAESGLETQGGTTVTMHSCYWPFNKYGYHNAEYTGTDAATNQVTAINTIFENNDDYNFYQSAGAGFGQYIGCWFEETGATTTAHICIDNDDGTASAPRNITFAYCWFDADPDFTFQIDNCNHIRFLFPDGGGTTGTRGEIGASATNTFISSPRGTTEFRPEIIDDGGLYTQFEYLDFVKDEGGPSGYGIHWMADRDNYVQIAASGQYVRVARSGADTIILQGIFQDSSTHVLETQPRSQMKIDGQLEMGAGGSTAPDVIKNIRDTETSTGAGGAIVFHLTLEDETAYLFKAFVVGQQVDGDERAIYGVTAVIYRDGGGGATLQGSSQDMFTPVESDGAWACAWTVNANDARLTATGDAANNVLWVADIEYMAVVGTE